MATAFGQTATEIAQTQESPLDQPEAPQQLPEVTVTPPPEAERELPQEVIALPTDTTAGPASPFRGLGSGIGSLSDQILSGSGRSGRSLFDEPGLATIVGPVELNERAPKDMFEALEGEVGVLIQRTAKGQAQPFIRGLTGSQVLILVDGIRVNNSTFRLGPNQYFNTIDPGQVERIEVFRGPQSVLWGSDALGGVINIVTKSANPSQGMFHDYVGGHFIERFSTADSASYSRLNVEGWVDRGGFFGGGSYLDVRDLDRGGDLGRQGYTNYSQYAGDIKFDYLLSEGQMLTLALQHFEQEDLPRSDRFPDFAGVNRPTFFDPQQRDLTYLRWQGVNDVGFINSFMVTASYARQKEGSREIRFNSLPAPDTRDLGEFDVNTIGLSVVLGTDLDWLGRLSYGADWYHDDVDAFRNRFDNDTGVLIGPRTPRFPDDSFYERVGVFLRWDVDLTERLNAIAGVRYENIDLGGTPIVPITPSGGGPAVDTPIPISPSYQDWIGSVGLVYEVTPCLHLVGNVSEGFRAPSLDDLTATNPFVQQTGQDLPSLDLEAEQSITYEVGTKFDNGRFRSQAFVWWTDLRDNILRDRQTAAPVFNRSNRDSYLNGVELAGEYLLAQGWSSYGNFWYTYGIDREFDDPLSRIPPTQGIVGLRWRDGEYRSWFDVYTWLVRRQDRLNRQQDIFDLRIPAGGTPGFGTLNLRTGTYCGDNQRISLVLENILDKAYRVHGSGVDGPGFNAVLTYELFF